MQNRVGMVDMMNIWFVYSFVICLALAQAQDNPGFISIDCGALNGYLDKNLSIQYSPDAGFVDSGHNMQISSDKMGLAPSQQMMNLRVFPNGTRNCYTIRPDEAKMSKYLIRASFYYGNFDNKSQPGSFDLYIDTNFWTEVSPSSYRYEEIVYTPSRDYIQVCLVNRGTGYPFISALEFRLIPNFTYPIASGALVLGNRKNYGSSITYRHPYDAYDRIWDGVDFSGSLIYTLKNMTNVVAFKRDISTDYNIPDEVLKTAMETTNNSYYIYQTWDSNIASTNWCIYFHFAEVRILKSGEARSMGIFVQNNMVITVAPEYLIPFTVISPPVSGNTITWNISASSLDESATNLAPFINAIEIFYVLDLFNSPTHLDDVNAMNNIKSFYGITKESWQGDPCNPKNYTWSGLICSDTNTPRITALNLSSSRLTGQIVPSFFNLTELVILDLSFNRLNGTLPEFLAQIPNLRVLNLEWNNLTGLIPAALQKKMKDGTMQIRLEGNKILQPVFCSPSKAQGQQKIVFSVVIGIQSFLLVMLAISYTRSLKERGNLAGLGFARSSNYDGCLTCDGPAKGSTRMGRVSKAYTSHEVSSITQDFKVTIGHGGFGSVFLGALPDGTKVAVKVLSQSSKQGSKEFQAEAQLLVILHHKNLVSLHGYCDELETMALIYELMDNGNLREHLSDNSNNILSWKQRLQIAIDAAQGLEYLHNGCKPPICHRDLKTANILLDENMHAKIADFGLSRAYGPGDESYISTLPAGTPGYLDPAFHLTGTQNRGSDLFSFGIVLFELITGHPAIIRDSERSTNITHWVAALIEAGNFEKLVDPKIQAQININSMQKAVAIATKCTDITPSKRPDINWVLCELKECFKIEM